MDEIYVVELYYKKSKKHSIAFFKSLEGAQKCAEKFLGYKNILVMILQSKIYD